MQGETPTQNALCNVLCNLAFKESKARRICAEILSRVLENGYVRIPKASMERYVVKKLVEVGILTLRELPACSANRMVKCAVLNMALVMEIYKLLQRPALPPLCV